MRKRFRVLNSNRNLKIVASLKGLPFFSISFFLSFYLVALPQETLTKGWCGVARTMRSGEDGVDGKWEFS